MESQDFKVLWDFVIQCDRFVQARRTDIVVVDKIKKEVKLIDIAIPGDCRVKEKEQEKIEKYEQLKEEIARLWNMKKVIVISVVIGAFGCITNSFESYMEKVGAEVKLQVVQKTALLGTASILRKTLSM